jgi:hypothetical protein
MPNYRVYTIIKSDKVAGRADVVTCATDAEALVKARQFLQSNDLEIWQGARMVSRLTTDRPAKAVTQHDVYSQTGR